MLGWFKWLGLLGWLELNLPIFLFKVGQLTLISMDSLIQGSHFSGQTKFPDFSLIPRDFSLIFLEVLNKKLLGKYCLFFLMWPPLTFGSVFTKILFY